MTGHQKLFDGNVPSTDFKYSLPEINPQLMQPASQELFSSNMISPVPYNARRFNFNGNGHSNHPDAATSDCFNDSRNFMGTDGGGAHAFQNLDSRVLIHGEDQLSARNNNYSID